jgi:hypothetical protein
MNEKKVRKYDGVEPPWDVDKSRLTAWQIDFLGSKVGWAVVWWRSASNSLTYLIIFHCQCLVKLRACSIISFNMCRYKYKYKYN